MKLNALQEDQFAEIARLSGDERITARLHSHGIHVGQKIRLVKKAPFKGPLLLEDCQNGARIMMSRSIAAHVEVQPENNL